ncbi:MAG TPA: amidohydrolase [Bryobacteraceae bacterium]|nr:amidohydrolase [Bryobacteraceae bacterium]
MIRGIAGPILTTVLAAAALAQTADLAVTNARIYTEDPKQPRVSAIAVRAGRILAIGSDLSRYIGPATKTIDAKGATIIPGFIDSHGHVRALGDMLAEIDLRGIRSQREIEQKVREAAGQRKPGDWIRGRAWDQNLWAGQQFPDERGISAAAPANPVVLERVDGHALWVNRKALDMADVNAKTPDPAGGKIMRDPKGAPTGVLLDRARELVNRKIPRATSEQVEQSLLRATRTLASVGITTVHDAGVQYADIDAYRALIRQGQLPIHIYAMILYPLPPPDKPEIGEYLTVRAVKLVADGALGSRGAAMIEPYSDDPGNRGLLILDRATIRTAAAQALAKGFQVNTHAIGDLANRTVLEAYGDVLKGPNDKRFRIEHAQIVAPADFAKFKQYSVIASMQPTHATSDMLWAEDRVGPERIKGGYAWQTFLHLGVHVPSGSDFPVEDPNPLLGFYAAITRQKPDGTPAGGWFSGQRMSREEALRSWTIEGAYAAFEEDRKGSLAPGKEADFAILSDDIMTIPAGRIPQARVMTTVAGGKIVYQR